MLTSTCRSTSARILPGEDCALVGSGDLETHLITLPVAGDTAVFTRLPMRGAEAMTAVSSRAFPRHAHDYYGVGVIDSGGQRSWSGRGEVQGAAGSLISANPGEVHDGRPIAGRPRSWRMIHIDSDVMDALCADVRERAGVSLELSKPVFLDPRAVHQFNVLFAYSGATTAIAAPAFEAVVLEFVALLVPHSSKGTIPVPSLANVDRVRHLIDENPAAPHSLVDLARVIDVSRYRLIRSFRRALGLSPHAYIVQRRLQLARRLLRDGLPPAEVAAMAGFADQSHLTRMFARQNGVTPSRYARGVALSFKTPSAL
jgi:AraC-like DNA-binding protein